MYGGEKMYTAQEVAEILKLNEQTIRRYLREKILGGKRLPRSKEWRIPERALEAFKAGEPPPADLAG
jgi:excisionase family DNA binding protein